MSQAENRHVTNDIVIVGSGGFGREVADVVMAVNEASGVPHWNLLGYLDDAPSDTNIERARRQGLEVVGPVNSDTLTSAPYFVVAINNGGIRRKLAERLESSGWKPATLIHPSAGIGSDCCIGEGSVLCAGVQITTNVTLGRHVHLNLNCTVGHDSVVEDFVSVNPLAAISGEVVIEERALIGTCATLLQNIRVGRGATVGGGAVVTRDVRDLKVVIGSPARELNR